METGLSPFPTGIGEYFTTDDDNSLVVSNFNRGHENRDQQIVDISQRPVEVAVEPSTLSKEQVYANVPLDSSSLNFVYQSPPYSSTAQDPLQSITVNQNVAVEPSTLGKEQVHASVPLDSSSLNVLYQSTPYRSTAQDPLQSITVNQNDVGSQNLDFGRVEDHEGEASGIRPELSEGMPIQDNDLTVELFEDPDIRKCIMELEPAVEFIVVPSNKKKNIPYLIHRGIHIITEPNEPVEFHLTGAQPCQMVSMTMRYTEVKYKNNPVEHDGMVNFSVKTLMDSDGNCQYDNFDNHPSAHLMLDEKMWDSSNEKVVFFITFRSLNSIHKDNGKKMELILKLKNPSKDEIIKENRFKIRVCKYVERDYKKLCEDEEGVTKKRMKTNAVTYITVPVQVPQATPICQEEEEKPQTSSTNPVHVHVLLPGVEGPFKSQGIEGLLDCVPAKEAESDRETCDELENNEEQHQSSQSPESVQNTRETDGASVNTTRVKRVPKRKQESMAQDMYQGQHAITHSPASSANATSLPHGDPKEKDEHQTFCEFIALKIRKLSTRYAKSTVQRLMHNIVCQAEQGQYNYPPGSTAQGQHAITHSPASSANAASLPHGDPDNHDL